MIEPTSHVLAELSTYLDGRLSGSEKRRVEAHIASCDSCKRHEHDLRGLRDLIHETPSMIPSSSLLESFGRPLLIVVAVIIVAVLGWRIIHGLHRAPMMVAEPVMPPHKHATVVTEPESVKKPPQEKPPRTTPAAQAPDTSIPALQELANTPPEESSATVAAPVAPTTPGAPASTETQHP